MLYRLRNELNIIILLIEIVKSYILTMLLILIFSSYEGFKEGEAACCGGGAYRGDCSCGGKRGVEEYELCENVSEYVFFDGAHPIDKADKHFSQLLWSGNTNITKPYNLKDFLAI